MNYNKLKYFYEIAKTQNISHTAEILFVSQSSLSKAVSDLEQDFGTKLFVRTNRNLILTEAGKELYRRVSPLFADEDEIYSAIRAAGQREQGQVVKEISVGFLNFALTCELPYLVQKYCKANPEYSIQCIRYNKAELITRMKKKQIDAAFLIFTLDEIPSGIPYRIMAEYHISVIVRKDHPLAMREQLTVPELEKESFLLHGHPDTSREYHYALSFCKRNGLEPNIAGRFDYVETLLMMVQSGLGIGLLSDGAPLKKLEGLVSVPLENAPVLYGGMFYREDAGVDIPNLFQKILVTGE